jgi:hypothetical protein
MKGVLMSEKNFVVRLLEIRDAGFMSMVGLAKSIGISFNTLYRYLESGDSSQMSLKTMRKIKAFVEKSKGK